MGRGCCRLLKFSATFSRDWSYAGPFLSTWGLGEFRVLVLGLRVLGLLNLPRFPQKKARSTKA